MFTSKDGRQTTEKLLPGRQLLASRHNRARVQLADFLAGIAGIAGITGITGKIASDELNERNDPGLTALPRPYGGRRLAVGRRTQR